MQKINIIIQIIKISSKNLQNKKIKFYSKLNFLMNNNQMDDSTF